MARRGVHFAITVDDLTALRSAEGDGAVMTVIEAIETRWEKEAGLICETDKAWEAIHRCLTDGRLTFDGGTDPLRLCILGGEQLYAVSSFTRVMTTLWRWSHTTNSGSWRMLWLQSLHSLLRRGIGASRTTMNIRRVTRTASILGIGSLICPLFLIGLRGPDATSSSL